MIDTKIRGSLVVEVKKKWGKETNYYGGLLSESSPR